MNALTAAQAPWVRSRDLSIGMPPAPFQWTFSMQRQGQLAPADRHEPAFWSLAAVASLMAVADLEATQDCLHDRRCTEANPLMPSRRAKTYAVQIPELLGVIWGSHRLRLAGHPRLAQIPLAALIVIHTAGTALAIRAEAAHR